LFSQFSKILDRTFVIGYFLPLVAFVAVSLWLLNAYHLGPGVADKLKADLLVGTTLLGLATYLGGMLLVLLNRPIYQILEGYYRWNPIRLWKPVELRRFKKLQTTAERLDAEYQKLSATPKNHHNDEKRRRNQDQRNQVYAKLADHFPELRWILPTAFGNIIRAFEVYPRIMYGIEDIQGWTRLLAVLPKSYLAVVDDTKSRTDFWVNATVLSFAALVEYIVVAISAGTILYTWFPGLTILSGFVSYSLACGAALEWGEVTKAAYDVFLPKLLKTASFCAPATKDAEELQWRAFSQAILYRRPDLLPQRAYGSTPASSSGADKEESANAEGQDKGDHEEQDEEENGEENGAED